MHLAQIIQLWGIGGAENLAANIASQRAAAGDRSHLIILCGAKPPAGSLDDRVAVHVLGSDIATDRSLGPNALWSLGRLAVRLVRIVREHEIEVVQTHLPLANYLGLALVATRSCRVFPTIHNNREFEYGERDALLRGRLRRWSYRLLLRYCDRMIAVSEAARRNMIRELDADQRWAEERIAVVPNGVPIPREHETGEICEFRRRFGVPDSARLIVGAGRLAEQKNFAALISAVARLMMRSEDVFCLIAGSGPLAGTLQDQTSRLGVESRIRFCGHIDSMSLLLAAADIFCLPSLWEGLPLVLLEAMAAGLPVVATEIDGVTEVVQPGRTGLLSPPGDEESLIRNLEMLLADEVLRQNLGRAGREEYLERYSLDRAVSELDRIYRL